ncbi:30S ribosomal protein S3 [Wolbachia endosymbiont of Pentidionis agamae]|uniref:30S ribosomal protein S3 n=1 Tax=Wolbachia endosymbiont of Pentidionis agamae TaxID=3110435 RepID=UPI002FCFA93D
MGQKVNPISFRLKVIGTWDSIWYAERSYVQKLHQDLMISDYIQKFFKQAYVSKVIISRQVSSISVAIHSARPGLIIGKKGVDIEKVKKDILKKMKCNVDFNVVEVKKSELVASLIASSIAQQLEKRISFKRAMKKAVQSCLKMGCKGIKVSCAGRLGGAEMARTEWYKEGRLPLHTLRANIDYAVREAKTVYGIIGIKVWVYLDN